VVSSIHDSQTRPTTFLVQTPLSSPLRNFPQIHNGIIQERSDLRMLICIRQRGAWRVCGLNRGFTTVSIPTPDIHIVHCIVSICECHHRQELEISNATCRGLISSYLHIPLASFPMMTSPAICVVLTFFSSAPTLVASPPQLGTSCSR
jgi:hypothetical protein